MPHFSDSADCDSTSLLLGKFIEAPGLSRWSVVETASRGTKGPRDVKTQAIDTVRLSSVTTTAIETFARSLYFTMVAAETLVRIKERPQNTHNHCRPVLNHVDRPSPTG